MIGGDDSTDGFLKPELEFEYWDSEAGTGL